MEKNGFIQLGRQIINPAQIVWVRHQGDGETWLLMAGESKPTIYRAEEAEALWSFLTGNCQWVMPEHSGPDK
jgi:hypothetical protein